MAGRQGRDNPLTAALSSLSIESLTLEPSFDPLTLDYTVHASKAPASGSLQVSYELHERSTHASAEINLYGGSRNYVGISSSNKITFIGYGDDAYMTVTCVDSENGQTRVYRVNLINSAA